MNEYLCAFPAGFGEIAASFLSRRFDDLRWVDRYDGLFAFRSKADPRQIADLPGMTNAYSCIHRVKTRPGEDMDQTVLALLRGRALEVVIRKALPKTFRFRVAFSDRGRLVPVGDEARKQAEDAIRKFGGKPDSQHPDAEFWFLRRSEGVAYFALRLSRHRADEKRLQPGELPPSIAFLLCFWAGIGRGDVVLDPFCGSGALSRAATLYFPCKEIRAFDRDGGAVKKASASLARLAASESAQRARVTVAKADALALPVEAGAAQVVLADPPWGFYEEVEDMRAFLGDMLDEFDRALAPGGTAIVMTARKAELETALRERGGRWKLERKLDALVHGKKAGLYRLRTLPREG